MSNLSDFILICWAKLDLLVTSYFKNKIHFQRFDLNRKCNLILLKGVVVSTVGDVVVTEVSEEELPPKKRVHNY